MGIYPPIAMNFGTQAKTGRLSLNITKAGKSGHFFKMAANVIF
jgi:hypothetical protein